MDELIGQCRVQVKGGVENAYGKVNVLLQTYISHSAVESFSLISDLSYVAQVGVCVWREGGKGDREAEKMKGERGGEREGGGKGIDARRRGREGGLETVEREENH